MKARLAILLWVLLGPSLWGEPPEKSEREVYLVLLKERSVVEEVLSRTAGEPIQDRRLAFMSFETSAYSDSLERSQLEIIDRLTNQIEFSQLSSSASTSAGDKIEVLDRRHYLTNVLIVRAPQSAATILKSSAAVRDVIPARARYPLLDAAPQAVHAPAYWEAIPGGLANAGRGMRIAIIDSGINQNHPMFSGEGLVAPPDFPKGTPQHTNSKVIVARSYHELFPNSQANTTPEDEMGHGSRVAAVAAGRQVDAPLAQIQGIAPMAFLGNYKVFGAPGRNSVTTSAAIIAALNDAVEDGMDVINMSLGGNPADPGTDPEQQAIALAVEAGVVVVVAAGNQGPGAETIRSPGTSPDAITVGAVTNGRIFGAALEVFANPPPPDEISSLPYLPGEGVSIDLAIGPSQLFSISLLDPSELACDTIPAGTLTGKMALVKRGGCLFQDKADHVFAAGAESLVVYNNVDGGSVVMAFDEERGPGGPTVMIDRSGGEQLRDFVLSRSIVTATLRSKDDLMRFPSAANTLTAFSSRGPSIDLSIKPDVSAVGSGIYSASRNGSEFTLDSSGTSFSCPMVAGAAALVLQLNPDWSAETVKSTLVATASKDVLWNGKPAGVTLTGSGRLDLARALEATAMVDPVSLSFGVLEVPESLETQLERSFQIRNLTEIERSYEFEVVESVLRPSVHMAVSPASLVLTPHQTASITLVFSSVPPLEDGSFEGYVQIVEKTERSELSLAYWGDIIPTDQGEVLEVSKSSPGAFQSLAEALKMASPGGIVEISDSSTYSGPIQLRFNAQGIPLDGLSIRATAGNNPVIDGSGLAGGFPVISINQLRNVTVEGLEIRGGLQGIEFVNATGVVRNNRISGTPNQSTGYGIHLIDSSVHLVENEISQAGGSAVSAIRSDALIQRNTIRGIGTENPNTGSGITASNGSILAVFDNLIQESGNGQGLSISDAAALVKGNVIINSNGEAGDGILATGTSAQLSIRDNLISNHQRAGLTLANGASGFLLRNRMFQNLGSGIRVEGQSSLVASALELGRNGTGIHLHGSSGVVSNSVLAFSSADGILSELSTLEVVNSTLFGNAGQGIMVASPLETKLSNSILFDNQEGSFSGIQELETFSNLIGDGQHLAANGNISGNPELEDPGNLVFTPLIGSPAIDTGDNSLVRESIDLYSHRRIVDGAGDGSPEVDIGAVEFASEFSAALLLPVLSTDPENFIGMAITNAHTIPTIETPPNDGHRDVSSVRLRTRSREGLEIESQNVEVQLQNQVSKLLVEYFESLEEGWIEVSPTGPDVASFSLLGNWETSILDGVPLVQSQSERIVFPEIRNGGTEKTTLFVVNPNDSELTVLLTWVIPSGSASEVNETVPANGMLKATFSELFGSGTGGYVIVEATPGLPIHGIEVFGTQEAIGALVALDYAGRTNELYAAQLASNDEVITILNVINSGTKTAEITFEAISERGAPIATVTQELQAGAQLRKSAKELFGFSSAQVGWVRMRNPSEELLGSLAFQDPSGKWLAALPLQQYGSREFILSHVAHTESIFTGVTLLNPSSEAALVSLEILDEAGEVTHATHLQLAAQAKRAMLLNQWVPAFEEQSGGFIRVRSNIGILGFELFGSYELDYMAAVPQQVIVQ